jgi:hypothetical protein
MIKLKDLLTEGKPPNIFVPRRMEDRLERMIKNYIRNGSKGYLNLRRMSLNKLPDILKNVNVGGSFNCSVNNLTSLENAPKSVDGDFYSSGNELTSLVGAPSSVGGYFDCSYNLLTSLEGAPETVGGFFDCRGNKLTSLAGVPKYVGGIFVCYDNPGNFTEEQVRAVCDVKGEVLALPKKLPRLKKI